MPESQIDHNLYVFFFHLPGLYGPSPGPYEGEHLQKKKTKFNMHFIENHRF